MMRATGYMALVNTILIVLIYLKVDNHPVLSKFSILIVFGWMSALVFLGWLETEKLKTPHFEAEKMLRLNPPLEFIYNKVKEIDERTIKIESFLGSENGL